MFMVSLWFWLHVGANNALYQNIYSLEPSFLCTQVLEIEDAPEKWGSHKKILVLFLFAGAEFMDAMTSELWKCHRYDPNIYHISIHVLRLENAEQEIHAIRWMPAQMLLLEL